ALLLGAAADDPAGAAFDAAGTPLAAPLQGVLQLRPYPVLHLPDGRPVLLGGDGKRGAAPDPALDGRAVMAAGWLTSRGSLAMLVPDAPPAPLADPLPAPAVEPLGRWRVTGEICDGKCAAGAMRPGTGLAHRACAVLCLDGELPPVLVAEAPLAGSALLLLGGPEGGPMPAALRPLIGLRVTLEGHVERRGGLLVLLADPASAVAR
ncbi:hypothetical protein, partial [Paracraurococcus ruber]|uniref:hypothetical protein n=1 Tax=Paracraurococcus ruber TaxID=77675 RepID=UPI0013051153